MSDAAAPCDLCGGRQLSRYVPGLYRLGAQPLDLVRCRDCSLVQVRPLPSPQEIAALYGDDYFERDYDSCLSADSYFDSFERLMQRYGALLDEIEALAGRGSLFEVGCAGGYFLKLARERGLRVEGIEITRVGAEHARERLGLEVRQSAFPDLARVPAGAPFDVVYMGHVLEHMRSPARAIEATRGLLSPGGLLVVEVPSYIDSFYFRALRRGVPVLRAAGADPGGLLRALKFPAPGEHLPPYHLYEFRRATLTRLLERFGYRVVRARSRVPKPDALAASRAPLDRALSALFDLLDHGARAGLPGGNIAVFARAPRATRPAGPLTRR